MVAKYNLKLRNILYHWLLSMALFQFCETYLLHIKLFVGNQSAISPFLGGFKLVHILMLIHHLIFNMKNQFGAVPKNGAQAA